METGNGGAVFARLPTNFAPVQVKQAEFTSVMTSLVLDMPLRVSSAAPVQPGARLAPGSGGSGGEVWRSSLAQSYGGFCQQRGTPGDCLTLYDDGPHLQADDKRKIALALAVGPALEGVAAEVRAMLNPTQLLATISFSITAYMALLVAPDPVITKSVAAAFTVLLWGYLGSELFDVIRAYAQLYEEAPRASTFAELRKVGERFGRVIGPNSVRILVMVGTAAVGETAELMSRAPKLPGFGQASRTVELNAELRLEGAAVEVSRIIISTKEGTLRAVLPMTAFAMAVPGGGGGHAASGGSRTPKEGKVLPNGHRGFKSFDDFKDHIGSPGSGNQWHHIVEQRELNLKRFGPEALHNTENVIPLGEALHTDVSAFYSSKQLEITGSRTLTVRQWLGTQSYEAQREFGLKAIENIRRGIWSGRR
ncbi:hypothetical protein [Archangium sp.]|uniref:SitA5 family polymorphic toxin n=1 Tax=Archangium sp. TaxID=1872627 RepID=UPI002D66180F|nr:hypothetical protein [Archangium sp.]HYO55371.1 hypothetical protein [Archangium sp.]